MLSVAIMTEFRPSVRLVFLTTMPFVVAPKRGRRTRSFTRLVRIAGGFGNGTRISSDSSALRLAPSRANRDRGMLKELDPKRCTTTRQNMSVDNATARQPPMLVHAAGCE